MIEITGLDLCYSILCLCFLPRKWERIFVHYQNNLIKSATCAGLYIFVLRGGCDWSPRQFNSCAANVRLHVHMGGACIMEVRRPAVLAGVLADDQAAERGQDVRGCWRRRRGGQCFPATAGRRSPVSKEAQKEVILTASLYLRRCRLEWCDSGAGSDVKGDDPPVWASAGFMTPLTGRLLLE